MIRESNEPGTMVWHEFAGFGYFKNWTNDGDAIVNFGDEIVAIPREDLTEVEDK